MPPDVRALLLVAAHSEFAQRHHMFQLAKDRGGSADDVNNARESVEKAARALRWLEDNELYATEG